MRSKNAGPFTLTFDFMFDRMEDYRKVRDSGVINADLFHKYYGTSVDEVEIYNVDAAQGIKASIPRPAIQCSPEDSDAYGGQLFGPLVNVEVPD